MFPLFPSELNGFLLIANLRDVSRIKLGSTDHETIIPNQRSVVGVDYDFDTGFIYSVSYTHLTLPTKRIV